MASVVTRLLLVLAVAIAITFPFLDIDTQRKVYFDLRPQRALANGLFARINVISYEVRSSELVATVQVMEKSRPQDDDALGRNVNSFTAQFNFHSYTFSGCSTIINASDSVPDDVLERIAEEEEAPQMFADIEGWLKKCVERVPELTKLDVARSRSALYRVAAAKNGLLHPGPPNAARTFPREGTTDPELLETNTRYELTCTSHFWNRCGELDPRKDYYGRWRSPEHKELVIGEAGILADGHPGILPSTEILYSVRRWERMAQQP